MSINEQNSAPSNLSAVLKAAALLGVLLVQIIPVYAQNDSFILGTDWFMDTDTYMRMVRVHDWVGALSENLNSTSWYGNISLSSNWPYGQTLHWTRPLDIIIAMGGLLLFPFIGMERGLYYAGVGVSPLLAVFSILVLFRATKYFLDIRGQISLAALVLIAPITRNYFYVARPDHHSLLIFLFTVAFAQIIFMFYEDTDGGFVKKKYPIIAGTVGAVAVWTSVEALVTAAFGALAIGAVWFVWGEDKNFERLRLYLWAMALAAIGAIVIERPSSQWITAVEYDRISIPHITLFVLLAFTAQLFVAVIKKYKSTHAMRLVVGTLVVAIPALTMALLFPDFYKGPFAGAMDARLQDLWLSKIQELKPIFEWNLKTLPLTIMHFGPLLWVGWWLGFVLREKSSVKTNMATTQTILIIAVAIILYVFLSVFQVRWAAYLGIVVSIPLAALAQRLFEFNAGPSIGTSQPVPIFRVPVVASVFAGPALAALLVVYLSPDHDKEKEKPNVCKWSEISPLLKDLALSSDRKINILTGIHEGPEVLYRTGQHVVGTPHHRNTAGILDSFTIMAGKDINEAFSILSRRGIDYLSFCKDSAEEKVYLLTEGDTLMRMIVEGRPPKWLEMVNQPAGIVSGFYLFRFNKNAQKN